MAGVFSRDKDTAEEWMKRPAVIQPGDQEMGIQLRGRSRDDFLARRLDLDCRRMKVNVGSSTCCGRSGPKPPS